MPTSKDLSYYMNLPYKIEIIPDKESDTFTAVIPDLKGCMAFGSTIEEAYEMVTEAKSLWLETALGKNWPIPEPKVEDIKEYSGRFNVRLPRSLHRELAELAEIEDISLNQLVLKLLAEGTERHRQPRPSTQPVFLRGIDLGPQLAFAQMVAQLMGSKQWSAPNIEQDWPVRGGRSIVKISTSQPGLIASCD